MYPWDGIERKKIHCVTKGEGWGERERLKIVDFSFTDVLKQMSPNNHHKRYSLLTLFSCQEVITNQCPLVNMN